MKVFMHASAGRNPTQLGSQAGVPDAPFKTSWPELALKRMIRYAADNGYDRISWDTGATNADRYDLSKQVAEVAYNTEGKQKGTLQVFDHSHKLVANPTVNSETRNTSGLTPRSSSERPHSHCGGLSYAQSTCCRTRQPASSYSEGPAGSHSRPINTI
jgi:hypothetical protein